MQIRVIAAYATVVALWSTTPLAIKWSGDGPGFLFGVTARMAIGTACVLLLLPLLRQHLPVHRHALVSYLAGAMQIFGAMLAVYWSAQFIPSGWISVVFGLSPLLTTLMASAWLGEHSLSPRRLLALALGIAGLLEMFGSAREFGSEAVAGITGVLVSALLQCGSAVWIKRIDARLPALSQLGGSLIVAMPAYLATWALTGSQWPTELSVQNLASIVYLGVVATTLGFSLYFFLLQKLTAIALSMITLVTPVLAVLLGHWINHEPVTARVIAGTGLVIGALLLHY